MQKVFSRVLIKDNNDNILVVQDRANIWNFPGGKKEIGETPFECAKREVIEEIGLHIHNLTEIFQGNYRFEDIQWRGHFYFANCVSGIPSMNELDKIKGIQFINSFDSADFPKELLEITKQLFESPLLKEKSTIWN
ncbi:NUDIX hydrolase [Metabacillus idriensis]|uniref:NUDIX domain-containing protein n=1 Tax=Metabacillus idriensis TaxID=324768 RepID=A0A6I2MAZ0_9BACI|nr:NUDIX hydrolase [Metabacillus idriensis]MCM3597576.1 NUDIX hydrolase [Metabacillus idriensis]MRX54497.1 NUDIX domain-containing protein [Metabacillus idriensis]